MNITIDKVLIWIIPYSYLVSIIYYWGFWGSFDIDVFNYYQVSDLIKGFTTPLGNTLISTLAATLVIFAPKHLFVKIIRKLKILWMIIIILLMFSLLAILLIILLIKLCALNELPSKLSPSDNELLSLLKHNFYRSSFIQLVIIGVTMAIERHFLHENIFSIKFLARSAGIYFLLALPNQAYDNGYERALKIKYNRSFDYIIGDGVNTPNKTVYKYLGKFGEYHGLTTINNNERIIISADKLNPLVVYKFSEEDTASRRAFQQRTK